MKIRAKNLLYDRLHKGSVVVCMVLTAYGLSILGQFTYRHFTQVRPQIEKSKAAMERELLAEGSSENLA